MTGKTTYKRIEAVTRTGEILKYLANQKEPVNGPQIASGVNLPVGTVMCHLATLEDIGFVAMIGDRFRIGMGAALLWARAKANLEADKVNVERDITLLNNGGNHE